MRQIWPSHLVSACSFSTLRLNLVLTHGIAPDVHDGVHIFSHNHYDIKNVRNTNYQYYYCCTVWARLMPVPGMIQEFFKKLASTSNLSDSCV